MQCDEFEDRLNAVLDERRRPEWDAELRLHAAECAVCRRLTATYDALLDGFYALATPEAPADMALRVLADVQPTTAPARRFAVVAVALATAAAVLIVVGPLLRSTQQGEHRAGNARVAARAVSPSPKLHASLEEFPLLPEFLLTNKDGGDPYAGLAKETGQGLATVVLYVPGVGGGSGIIDVEEDGGQGEPAWAVQMSEGLKPLTETVTETVNLLLRSLPVSQFASRS